jgi:tetratricopeptide (TPR) repeat protein
MSRVQLPTGRHGLLTLGSAGALLLLLTMLPAAQAGLYTSEEKYAELPSQWRGFLLDQRTLRNIAVKPASGKPASPARVHYLEAAQRLERLAQGRRLTADEAAELGALYVRLGELEKAVGLLRPAFAANSKHFHLAANLATAWQLQGDLQQAELCLAQAVRLAPGKYQRAEEYHLKLVRLRLREPRGAGGLDDLFGVRYVADHGKYEPGQLAAAQRKKLPAGAVAVVQQLALWLPGDARLLWQLAELASVHGDVRTGAAILDGCVTQFGMGDAELRRHRQLARAAADKGSSTDHETHAAGLAARSRRPLLTRLDSEKLPPISPTRINALPWVVLSETTVDRKFKPTFVKYLRELEGKQVTLNGFIQPLREDADLNAFMLIENPVGCWYCEMPEIMSIIYVELPRGRTVNYTRGLVRVVGRLVLNDSNPEEFLYTIKNARVTDVN